MNEIIQNLKANATNGKENFCYISENKLLAMQELSKRENRENTNLKQALNEIREYITSHIIYEDLGDGYCYECDEYDEEEFLQIINKALPCPEPSPD